MATLEGEEAGSVGDAGPLGDEWAFTLYDGQEREIAAFVFHDERDARQAHKAMQVLLARAVAISPAPGDFIAIPFTKARAGHTRRPASIRPLCENSLNTL